MSIPRQAELFAPAPATPDGFRRQPGLVDQDEEAELVARLGELRLQPFDFHGFLARRQVIWFGQRYDYGRRGVVEAPPIPAWLTPLRAKVARFAERPAEAFAQVLINQYPPGAGIGWHRDKPQFDEVAAVSLLAPCILRFRRAVGAGWDRLAAPVEPRSAYLLSGAARSDWEHSIRPMDQLRYSITFRTLKGPADG